MMPLLVPTLASGIQTLIESVAAGPAAPDPAALSQLWADAFAAYMLAISNPPPGAGTAAGHQAGKAAFQAALQPALTEPPPAGLVALTGALTAYAAAFAATTAPFVSLPPPAPLPTPPSGEFTASVAAQSLASTIHTWALTGTASFPPAPPAPWL